MFYSFQLVPSVKISCVMWSLFFNHLSSFSHHAHAVHWFHPLSKTSWKEGRARQKAVPLQLSSWNFFTNYLNKMQVKNFGIFILIWLISIEDIKANTVTCNDLFSCLTIVKVNIAGYHVLMFCLIPFLIICFII